MIKIKIEHEPLLLEAFGPCLPRAEALHKFFQQVHLDTFHLIKFVMWSLSVILMQVMDKPEGIKSIQNFFLGLT